MTKLCTITIDGPSGVGKSTVAKLLAATLGYTLIDTGAMYRALALVLWRRELVPTPDQTPLLSELATILDVTFKTVEGALKVFLGTEEITTLIRTPEISQLASKVSVIPEVRKALVAKQQRLAAKGGAVLEGRDTGTVVCPTAEVKIFLTASLEERARRRFLELTAKDPSLTTYAVVLQEMEERDVRDSSRDCSPLRPAKDALYLDCTDISAEKVVQYILEAVEKYQCSAVPLALP